LGRRTQEEVEVIEDLGHQSFWGERNIRRQEDFRAGSGRRFQDMLVGQSHLYVFVLNESDVSGRKERG